MDEQKKTKKAPKKAADESEKPLVPAAKAVGSAAETVAASVGVQEAPARKVSTKPVRTKLQPKNKSRMPRRQKKALQKAAFKAR
jgi:hypothetical protein